MLNADIARGGPLWRRVDAVPSRQTTVGRESAFVRRFCEERIAPAPSGEFLTVFVEPKIDSAFPDLVAIYWDIEVASRWPEARRALSAGDLKQLHYLHTLGNVPIGALRARLGDAAAARLVHRLIDCQLADVRGDELRCNPVREIFAIRRLVAIEAKISDWRRGLRQAFMNLWFASESFLLLPSLPRAEGLLARARELGLGIVSGDQDLSRPAIKSTRVPIPRSYASWLLNEWAWRHCDLARG